MGITILHPASFSENDPINSGRSPEITLDIIALHGLNGTPTKTWTCPKTQKLWLRDFLPSDLPRARIMTFGYDATAAFANSTAGIVEHARDLLGCLMEVREGCETQKRPSIFIGHSLGGLVIKQALIIASQEPRYKEINHNVLGILFFGTPHQGSSLATLASTIIQIPTLLAIKPTPELLESLRKGGPRLVELSENFRKYHEERGFEIVSFYETRTLRGMNGLVVEKVSALLTPLDEVPTFEEQIPVDADHRQMCRFSTKKDKTYKTTVRSIRRIYQGGRKSDVGNEYFLLPATLSAIFTGRNDIRVDMRDALIEGQHLGRYVERRYVLHGLGGSGKTQLALKFGYEYRESFWGVFWIDATSNETAEESFRKISQSCQLEGDTSSIVKAYLSAKEHWLLIIDNADDPTVDVSEFFPSTCGKGTVLITTRNPDLQKWASVGSFRVDEMSCEDAIGLLLKTAATDGMRDDSVHSGRKAEKRSAEQIVKVLGYFALAIVQAGAAIRQGLCNLEGFCDFYHQHKRDLLESGRSHTSNEYQHSVFTTWEISVRSIESREDKEAILAMELLRMFAFMHFSGIKEVMFKQARINADSRPDPMGQTYKQCALMTLMPDGWNGMLFAKALVLLLGFSLISIDQERQISMHPLVHEWSRLRMSEVDQTRTWKRVVATLGMLTMFSEAFFDHQNRKMILPHIEPCLSNRIENLFAEGNDSEERLLSARTFTWTYRESHRWEAALELGHRHCKALESNESERRQRVVSMEVVAECLSNLGQHEQSIAMYNASLAEALKTKDFDIIIAAKVGLAVNYNIIGKYQEAIEICTATLKEFETTVDKGNILILCALEAISKAHNAMGNPHEAVKYAERVYEGRKVRDGERHIATITSAENLADIYADLKLFKRSRDLQEQQLNLLEETLGHDHTLTLVATCRLADLPRRRGNSPLLRKRGIRGRREVLDRCRIVLGETHPTTLACLEHLAEDLYICGALQKSKALHEDLVQRSIQRFGSDDENTIRVELLLRRISRLTAITDTILWWVPERMRR